MSAETGWHTLNARIIWVDLARSALTLAPAIVALTVFNIEFTWDAFWPFAVLAGWGVLSSIADVLRWATTRYRVTDTAIERRTGLFLRRSRTVQRDRIRSVDTHARLRHRATGLRVVTVGAGQQTSGGESALVLDAISRDGAEALRRTLMRDPAQDPGTAEAAARGADAGSRSDPADAEASASAPPTAAAPQRAGEVTPFASARPRWVLYNMFNGWAFLMAAGILWGGYWLAATFGIDLLSLSSRIVDWASLHWAQTTLIALVVAGVLGSLGMAAEYVASYWNFRLDRVRTETTSFIRTRRGLFSTREVNRDEFRLRGITLSDPLFWRWLRLTDTNVITTGLSMVGMEQPSEILPRTPRRIALPVARHVLGTPCPIEAELPRHPVAALWLRLWRATLISAGLAAALVAPVAVGVAPTWTLWAALGSWPLLLCGAAVAYLALGHTIHGPYLVVRAGFLSRSTSALKRSAVSTIVIRQSLFQRRLRIGTVSAMTAAGVSSYEAIDIAADELGPFAMLAAPGVLDPFVAPVRVDPAREPAPASEASHSASHGGL